MNDLEKTIFDIIAKEAQIPREKISLDATMQDLDVHSLDAIQVVFEIEDRFGHYYPDRDGVTVSQQGAELLQTLDRLAAYGPGSTVRVGEATRTIAEVITIDGRKMLLDDGSWIMIRPSGTEPKVRFYVEARSAAETPMLVQSAKSMLAEIGLLP